MSALVVSMAHLDSWGHALVGWAMSASLATAILLAVTVAAERVLARRVRASWRLFLYAPLLVRAVLPAGASLARLAPAGAITRVLTPLPLPVDLDPASVAVRAGEAHGKLGFTVFALATLVYLAVVLVMAVRGIRQYARLSRSLVGAESRELADGTSVLVHPTLGPLVAGVMRPRIVLPASLVLGVGSETVERVLRHERAHLHRGDPLLAVLLRVLAVAGWPIVPLAVAVRRMRTLIEIACDEDALAAADGEERQRYGHTLLEMAEGGAAPAYAPGQLHFGSSLRERIEAIVDARRWTRATQLLAVTVVVGGLVACASPGAATGTWSAPAADPLTSLKHPEALITACRPFYREDLPQDQRVTYWKTRPVGDLPAAQVTYCRQPGLLDRMDSDLWSAEARNTMGKIGVAVATNYDRRCKGGDCTLCPPAAAVPANVPAAGDPVTPAADVWSRDAGWSCVGYASSAPTHFQYALTREGDHVVQSARGQRTRADGTRQEVYMTLDFELDSERVMHVGDSLHEHWSPTL